MDNVNAKPMMMADNVRNAKMDSNFIVDCLIDLFFILDIILNFTGPSMLF